MIKTLTLQTFKLVYFFLFSAVSNWTDWRGFWNNIYVIKFEVIYSYTNTIQLVYLEFSEAGQTNNFYTRIYKYVYYVMCL